MLRSRLDRFAALLAAASVVGLVLLSGVGTDASFVVTTDNTGNTFSTIADWKPPIVNRATVLKAEGGIPGYVRAGASYTVVADVADDPSSNPPAGLGGVTTNVSNLTTGAAGLTMTASASTVGGLTYSHKSTAQTVTAGKAAGTYTNSITASDTASPVNTASAIPFTAVVDNTAPTVASVTITNGGIAGRADAGDTVTFTWSETIDPQSVLAGWTGAAATPVTVQFTNHQGATGDTFVIQNSAGTASLPLGTVETHARDFVTGVTTFGGPANATRSTLTWNSGSSLTVTLGPVDQPANINTAGNTAANFDWLPDQVYDRAGNLSSTTTWVETGALDRDF